MLGTRMIAAALAAPHLVESGKAPTVADGDRYAAWVHGANVRVLELPAHFRRYAIDLSQP